MNTTIGQEINMAQQEPTLYIPPNCTKLSAINSQPQIRLGVQGFPGTGKTWAALTFPNPIVLNLDRGLGAHQGREDVIEIPFYKPEFCGTRVQLKDKLIVWLDKEGFKLTENQTLIIDSLSALEIAYHLWFEDNKLNFLTDAGQVNKFIEWQLKEKYFNEINAQFKSLRCSVVILAHEAERPDKPTTVGQPGMYTGKIRPVLTGKAGDIFVKDYTDWFRQHASDKPKDYNSIGDEQLAMWKMTKSEFRIMCDSFPRNTIYYWQLEGDDKFDGKASSLVNFPRYLPANYQSFLKYRRKV